MAAELYPNIYIYRRIVQAKLFIDAHFAEDIDLENIADEACFSKFHFTRLFRKAYGKTPHQYLISVRIENAKLLLPAASSSSDVCYAVGFSSISSFTGLFKKITGYTPAAFQSKQQLLQMAIAHSPLNFIPNCFAQVNGWS